MTTRNRTTAIQTALDFKGFDDLVELFKAGEQTDSLGHTRNFTTDDLDDMVDNHEPFPIVIGHPKVNAPAYGWSSKLVRKGDSLYGKFADVESQFADMVEKKRFPNRSLRLRLTDDGFKVAHVGFLGAAAPAIPGLKSLDFAQDANGLDFEFSGYADTVLAKMMRRLREFLIEKFSVEDADKVMPAYALDVLAEDALRDQLEDKAEPALFNQPILPVLTPINPNNPAPGGATVPKTYTQAEFDAAIQQQQTDFAASSDTLKNELKAERKARLSSDHQAFVAAAIDAGKLTPALAAGVADFMLQLDDIAEFEFSQGDGATDQTRRNNGCCLV